MTDARSAPHPVETEVDGVRLHAEWRRAPVRGKPDLVFLHDGLGSVETWRAFPDLLADEIGLGAFAYDRWGYGRSDVRAAFPARFMDDAAKRLPKVLAVAEIDDYVLIGHSDGGTIALLHGATNPRGLRAVVSLSAHVHGDRAAYAQLQRLGKIVDDGDVPQWMFEFHGERGPRLLRCWVDTWRTAFDAGWNIEEALTAIATPLLAIHGADDIYGLPGQLEGIAKAVPHAETRLLPGIGHFPHLDDPHAMVRDITEFLGGIDLRDNRSRERRQS